MTGFEWLAMGVSVTGAVASWGAFVFQRVKTRDDRTIEMGQKWSELGVKRELFWTALREAYCNFRNDNPYAPESLDALIGAAGAPPDLYPRGGRDLRLWPNENASKLGTDQRLMWEFVSQVYPSQQGQQGKITDYSSISPQLAIQFHEARGAHAHFWKNWASVVSMRYLCRHYASARLQVVLLCWLEIALVHWTQDAGEGKTPLFRFAQKVSR